MFGGAVGTSEIILIILVIVIFFGAEKIPELARGLGKGMQEFQKASDSIKDEFDKTKEEFDQTKKDINQATQNFSQTPQQQRTEPNQKKDVIESEQTTNDEVEIEKDNSKNS